MFRMLGATFCAVLLLSHPASAVAQPPDGWLNARDFGASGSEFTTVASTTAGSNQITVADPGDFRPGQGVMVSRCKITVTGRQWGPGEPYSSSRTLEAQVEVDGYDGAAGSWLVYLLELDGKEPLTFRWSDDLARTWKATKVPVTFDWQTLSNGVKVKFASQARSKEGDADWQPGHMITFSARDQLVTRIEKIEGNTLTLAEAANRSAEDAVVAHNDQAALQAAVDAAIKQKRNLFVPDGHYRLSGSVRVPNAAITIEGQSAENTLLDITDGKGPCLHLQGGSEVTVRNFSMLGHTGLAEAAGSFRTSSGFGFWASALRGCNAMTIAGTERTLVENVHARRMASEAFYAQWPCRTSTSEPKQYQKSLTYLRCSVTDCAANAFNNNDTGENTSVLQCRIDGAGWHAAEMPAKFFRFIGNYVRNSGPVTVGDMSHRVDDLHRLGCGQAIVSDNVFEGIGRCGGIVVNHGSSQVVIANNLFINYNGPAITVAGQTVRTSFPSNTMTITGNIIDMTCIGDRPASRTGIRIAASNVIAANNQVYVRGAVDPRVMGIVVNEPALKVRVHDNLVRNCNWGLLTGRAGSRVTEVIDEKTFVEAGLPLEWKDGHRYRGWHLVWLAGGKPLGLSTLEGFDPETLRFILKEPWEMKVGDRFEVFPPRGPNWDIRGNTITGCQAPVVLDSYGGETALFRGNVISRGETAGVANAVESHGRFSLIGNHLSGFDEPGAAGLYLCTDKLGNAPASILRDNVVERCTEGYRESGPGVWEAANPDGNQFIACGADLAAAGPPKIAATAVAPPRPVLRAPRLAGPVDLDGKLDEWPLDEPARVAAIKVGPAGEPIAAPRAFACAAHDGNWLYLAVRCTLPEGYTPAAGLSWQGDGVEVSFRCVEGALRTPIFILWGTTDGTLNSTPQGGATPEQVNTLERTTGYKTWIGPAEWTGEWRIPLRDLGIDPLTARRLLFNIGCRWPGRDLWLAWTPTGGSIYEVDSAGDLTLE